MRSMQEFQEVTSNLHHEFSKFLIGKEVNLFSFFNAGNTNTIIASKLINAKKVKKYHKVFFKGELQSQNYFLMCERLKVEM